MNNTKNKRELACYMNKILRNCTLTKINNANVGYKLTVERCKALKNSIEVRRQKILKCKSIKDVETLQLNFLNLQEVKLKEWINIISFNNCQYDSKSCVNELKRIEHNTKVEDEKIKSQENLLLQEERVFEQIKEKLNNCTNKQDVYIRFSLNKNRHKDNELICCFLNYSNFISGEHTNLDMYVSHGDNEYNEIKLQLIYKYDYCDNRGILEIPSFGGNKEPYLRCKHGSFALKCLTEVIPIINNIIHEKKKNNTISEVGGDIVPTEEIIAYKDLYNLYDKNGYITDGKLLREF